MADQQIPTTPSHCPACAGTEIGAPVAVPDREYRIPFVAKYGECLGCGTLVQVPMPTVSELGAFYPSDYHAATAKGLLSETRHLTRFRKMQPRLQGDGALLDYGCGNGSFLLWSAGRNLGRPLYGYEIGDKNEIQKIGGDAVTIVRGEPGFLLEVVPPCRLITMNHVIEHLPDPLAVVADLGRRLLPDGVLWGETPAADSLERRLFGTRWSGYHAPRHTVVFSRAGLRRLLERAGLGAVEVEGAFNPAAWAVSLASLWGSPERGIRRSGPEWIGGLLAAAALAPIDLLSGAPGIIRFGAVRAS